MQPHSKIFLLYQWLDLVVWYIFYLFFFFALSPKGSFILLKRQRKGLEKLALIKLYFPWPQATQFK